MKILIILHLEGKNTFSILLKQQKLLKSLAINLGYDSDTYIYSNKDNYSKIDKKQLIGKVYYQEISILIPTYISEELSLINEISEYSGFTIAEDELSNEIALLLSLKLKLDCITNVTKIVKNNNSQTFSRFSYNNNLLVDYSTSEAFVISIRGLKSNLISFNDNDSLFIKLPLNSKCEYLIEQKIIELNESYLDSNILLAIGMGVNSKSEIEKIRGYAKENKITFGVTRPVAMRGWAKISEIIGVSGNIYDPKICITIGVSGSPAFYVGIENSDYILSINIDDDAPIVQLSNHNIVSDYKVIIDDIFKYIKL